MGKRYVKIARTGKALAGDVYDYDILWDSETDTFVKRLTYTTACGFTNKIQEDEIRNEITEEEKKCILEQLTNMYLPIAVEQTLRNEATIGETIEVKETTSTQAISSTPCQKCNGTGKWINPNNDEDKRQCFSCDGTGEHIGYVRDEKGKKTRTQAIQGTIGEIVRIWTYTYRGKKTIKYVIKTEDGELLLIPQHKATREEARKSTEKNVIEMFKTWDDKVVRSMTPRCI